MIRCEEFLAQVSELIDREMDGARAGAWDDPPQAAVEAAWLEAMKAHAQQCRNCFVIYETTKQTIRLVGDETLFELPPEVSQRLHAALDRRLGEAMGREAPQPDAQRYQPERSGEAAGSIVDLPWTPPQAPRPWWRSGGLAFAAALLLLAAVAGAHWWGRSQTVYVAGWLSDVHCAATYRQHPELHPRQCMLVGRCQQSGFGVIDAHGHFTPFNAGATDQVVTLLETNTSPDHIWVQADGREHDGVLQVKDIELRSPDQRMAGLQAASLLRDVSAIMAPAGWR